MALSQNCFHPGETRQWVMWHTHSVGNLILLEKGGSGLRRMLANS
jgi:hypothetical protein